MFIILLTVNTLFLNRTEAETNDSEHQVEDVVPLSKTDALFLEAATQVDGKPSPEGSIVSPGTCNEAEQPGDTVHGQSAETATMSGCSEGNLSLQVNQ